MSPSPKNPTSADSKIATGIAVAVIILLAFFLPPANTLLLFMFLVFCWWLAWCLPEPQNAQDFTFTATELDTFEALEPRAKRMQRELASLRKQGAHLSKRKDGYLSERSKLGKQLNPQIQQLERGLGEDQAFIVDYSGYADERKQHYIGVKSTRMAITLAAIVYGLAAALLLNTSNSAIATIALFINTYGFIAPPANTPYLWGVLASAALLSVISYLLVQTVCRFLIRLKLSFGTAMDTDTAIEFSSQYAAASNIGEA